MSDHKLDDLNQKLAQFREGERAGKEDSSEAQMEAQNMNVGMRAGFSLVTAIISGGLIGWGLDSWLHTRPVFLMVFFLAGIAAGFMEVYRVTNNLGPRSGFAALQNAQKKATKAPQTADNDDQA